VISRLTDGLLCCNSDRLSKVLSVLLNNASQTLLEKSLQMAEEVGVCPSKADMARAPFLIPPTFVRQFVVSYMDYTDVYDASQVCKRWSRAHRTSFGVTRLELSHPKRAFGVPFLYNWSQLKNAVFRPCGYSGSDRANIDAIVACAPQLRQLVILPPKGERQNFVSLDRVSKSLTELDISTCEAPEVLSAFVSLTKLRVELTPIPIEDLKDLKQLRELDFSIAVDYRNEYHTSFDCFPALEVLTLRSTDDIKSLLTTTSLPSLRKLAVIGGTARSTPKIIRDFVPRFGSIEDLTVCISSRCVEEVASLSESKSITRITLMPRHPYIYHWDFLLAFSSRIDVTLNVVSCSFLIGDLQNNEGVLYRLGNRLVIKPTTF
jgi:hypothetical protein